jgi:hypothetical protein
MRKKWKVVGGAAILCFAIGGGLVAWQTSRVAGERHPALYSRQSYTDLEVGDRLCLPASSWSGAANAARTVVVVGSATCSRCSMNRSFEDVLYDRCQELGIPVVYVLPDRRDQDELAKGLASEGRDVRRADLHYLGVARVPTVLAVGNDGTIQAMWTGSVPPSSADDVLSNVTTGVGRRTFDHVAKSRFEAEAAALPSFQLIALSAMHSPPSSGTLLRYFPGRVGHPCEIRIAPRRAHLRGL